jgi:hypothetical protein
VVLLKRRFLILDPMLISQHLAIPSHDHSPKHQSIGLVFAPASSTCCSEVFAYNCVVRMLR